MMGVIKATLVSDVRNAKIVLRVMPSPNFGGGFPSHLQSNTIMADALSAKLGPASYQFNIPVRHNIAPNCDKISGIHHHGLMRALSRLLRVLAAPLGPTPGGLGGGSRRPFVFSHVRSTVGIVAILSLKESRVRSACEGLSSGRGSYCRHGFNFRRARGSWLAPSGSIVFWT